MEQDRVTRLLLKIAAEKTIDNSELEKEAGCCGCCGAMPASPYGDRMKRLLQDQMRRYNDDARTTKSRLRARVREYVEIYKEPDYKKFNKPSKNGKLPSIPPAKIIARYVASENYIRHSGLGKKTTEEPSLDRAPLKFEKVK